MRSRSGAIHADTEELFMQLATASHHTNGLFYDDRTNRRVIARLTPSCLESSLNSSPNLFPIPELSLPVPSNTQNCFAGFDFGLEFEVERQEREQLQRRSGVLLGEVNVGIVASKPKEVVDHLCQALQLGIPENSWVGGVDLVVGQQDFTIYKYWVFDRACLDPNALLLQLYLQRCSITLELEECSHQLTVVSSGLEEGQTCTIHQKMLSTLSY